MLPKIANSSKNIILIIILRLYYGNATLLNKHATFLKMSKKMFENNSSYILYFFKNVSLINNNKNIKFQIPFKNKKNNFGHF